MNDLDTLVCSTDDRLCRQDREIADLRLALQRIVKLAERKDTGGAAMIAAAALFRNVA